MKALLGLLALGLAACSGPPIVPVTRIVRVHTTSYVPIPQALLDAPCPATAPRREIATVNDLISGLDRDQAAADCRQGKLDAIRTLKAPPSSTG